MYEILKELKIILKVELNNLSFRKEVCTGELVF